MRSVLIVGAGLAGSRCAEALRTLGYDGRVTVVGEEPVPPYERPALSKEFLLGERRAEDLFLRPPTFWEEHRIELVLGHRVVGIHAGAAITDRGDRLTFDALVLATGARARRLAGASPADVHVLRTLADAHRLRNALVPGRRLAVIGGGFVGAEVASSARALGLEVSLLEAAEAPFASLLGDEVGAKLARRYREHGVDLHTRAAAAGFRLASDGRVAAVRLGDGGELPCDVTLVAVGIEPARELAAHATAHVCGDANGGAGHWTSAAHGGVAAAHHVLGLEPPPPQPAFFWSDQFGLRLQLLGEARNAASVEVDGSDESFVARYRNSERRLIGALAANRATEVGALRQELALAA